MTEPVSTEAKKALQAKDPFGLAEHATIDQLDALKRAEELIEVDQRRIKTMSRFAVAAQVMVGWVAVLGFLVNAYQSFANKQQQHEQARIDQNRWSQEFERARQADKYRAFFETSVLATDPSNPDKRLVGYALLQEFVSDPDYTSKAMLMLEESLAQELRSNTDPGIDQAHRNAVLAIVTALSETKDCRALVRASRSIDRLARRHRKFGDAIESGEVFKVYVYRLLGQAASVCTTMEDFRQVRRPLRDTLMKIPEMAALKAPITVTDANTRIAQILQERCLEDLAVSGASDCAETFAGYAQLCDQPESTKAAGAKEPKRGAATTSAELAKEHEADVPGCQLMHAMAVQFPTSGKTASK